MRITWRHGFKRAQVQGTAPKRAVLWHGEVWGINLEGEKVRLPWRANQPMTVTETIAVMHNMVDQMREEIGSIGVDAGWTVACR